MSTDKIAISQKGWDPDLYQVIASTLERIETGEKEGGSKGFIDHFNARRSASEKPAEPIKFSKSIPFICYVGASPERDLVLEIKTEDGYAAKYTRAFWPVVDVARTGMWNFNSWEDALKGPNTSIFTANEPAIPVIIKQTGEQVGQFIIDPSADGESIMPGFAPGYQLLATYEWRKM